VTQTGGDSHEWGERCGDKERRADDDDTGEWGKTRWLGSRRASEEGGGKKEGRGRGAIDAILLAEELAHARLPPPALVERDASVIGAAPGEPCALPPEHVDELLLAQVAHLLVDEDDDQTRNLAALQHVICLFRRPGCVSTIDHLLHVVVVILQAEIDVGLHAAELDRRPIVRPVR